MEPSEGLFRQCIREIFKSVEESTGDDGMTTNNRPFEFLANLGTKIKLTLEMFLVDVTTLQHPSTSNGEIKRVITELQFHLGTEQGSISAHIRQLVRNSTEGVLVSKRKR